LDGDGGGREEDVFEDGEVDDWGEGGREGRREGGREGGRGRD